MRKRDGLFIGIFAVLALGACQSPSKNEASKTEEVNYAAEWAGVYSNVLPCADCVGIQTTLRLRADSTYEKITRYLDRDTGSFLERGRFTWDPDGKKITLEGLDDAPAQYLPEGDRLVQLDMAGMEIPAEEKDLYTLFRIDGLVEHPWQLVEVNGNPVPEMQTLPYLIFQVDNNRLVGSGGCNSLTATYIVSNGNRLQITHPVSTLMACLNMEVEEQLFKALSIADSYSLSGDTLVLNRARMAPLAVFVKE